MTKVLAKEIVDNLRNKKVPFERGLLEEEILQIESKFKLTFPPDLKAFLQSALPVSNSFVNWRLGLTSQDEEEKISSRLNWPLDGMIFDIKNNEFWFDQWCNKPDSLNDQIELTTKFYYGYPKLIPIYSHRYIPSQPSTAGNPVFSVYQMDIIYYGYDLASYFAREFKYELSDKFEMLSEPKVEIDFWSYCSIENFDNKNEPEQNININKF